MLSGARTKLDTDDDELESTVEELRGGELDFESDLDCVGDREDCVVQDDVDEEISDELDRDKSKSFSN
jgi:hypothetical protein